MVAKAMVSNHTTRTGRAVTRSNQASSNMLSTPRATTLNNSREAMLIRTRRMLRIDCTNT